MILPFLLSLLCVTSLCADTYYIENKAFVLPESVGKRHFFYDTVHGFVTFESDELTHGQILEIYNIDPKLRNISIDDLNKALLMGYIKVSQDEQKSLSLQYMPRLKGGGIGGAWVGMLTGKFVVHFVAQAGIAIATTGVFIICPPAAAPFAYAAEATVAPFVEAASNVAALGCGIFGAAVTGPV